MKGWPFETIFFLSGYNGLFTLNNLLFIFPLDSGCKTFFLERKKGREGKEEEGKGRERKEEGGRGRKGGRKEGKRKKGKTEREKERKQTSFWSYALEVKRRKLASAVLTVQAVHKVGKHKINLCLNYILLYIFK